MILSYNMIVLTWLDWVVIFRKESPTIEWLCEELVRRLVRRRKSLQTIPEPANIYLTRASDGAELFSEDPILDLLTDNEMVRVRVFYWPGPDGHILLTIWRSEYCFKQWRWLDLYRGSGCIFCEDDVLPLVALVTCNMTWFMLEGDCCWRNRSMLRLNDD